MNPEVMFTTKAFYETDPMIYVLSKRHKKANETNIDPKKHKFKCTYRILTIQTVNS